MEVQYWDFDAKKITKRIQLKPVKIPYLYRIVDLFLHEDRIVFEFVKKNVAFCKPLFIFWIRSTGECVRTINGKRIQMGNEAFVEGQNHDFYNLKGEPIDFPSMHWRFPNIQCHSGRLFVSREHGHNILYDIKEEKQLSGTILFGQVQDHWVFCIKDEVIEIWDARSAQCFYVADLLKNRLLIRYYTPINFFISMEGAHLLWAFQLRSKFGISTKIPAQSYLKKLKPLRVT